MDEPCEGILLDVYPKLFTLYNESSASTVSFSYAEILTREVEDRKSKGRNRTEETEGILLDVYPKLFTLYDESSASTVSFSYAEILTREVELEIVTRV